MSIPPHLLLLWIGLAGAALTDFMQGRIPNLLTGAMMAAGLGTHVILGDPWFGVIGLVGAFVVHFVLFALGVTKAGDAKLMMGVGACVGLSEMLETTAWWMILYIPVGIVILALRGRLTNFVAAARYSGLVALGRDAGEPPEATYMIAGPVIAVAGVIASLTDWLPELSPL